MGLVAALFLTYSAFGTAISPVLVNPANGHSYVLLGQNTWANSESEALALGGHLVTVDDQAEQDWIFATFGSYAGVSRLLWIGLTDAGHEGQFTWISGEPVNFTAWAPGEPNSIPGEDFVAIYYPGHSAQNRWNDWGNISSDPVGLPFNAVVEIDPGLVTTNLITPGSTWKYLNNGLDQGISWRAGTFNDASWPSGPAQLGYGDGDEKTMVPFGNDPANKPITTYFRHSFVLPALDPAFSRLRVRWLRDDGGIVYINGSEVYRSGMPAGSVSFQTLASTTVQGGDESALHSRFVPITALRDGSNVVAVEVHQSAPDSSDMSFDLELVALQNRAPVVSVASPAAGEILGAGKPVQLVVNAGDDFMVTNVVWLANGRVISQSAVAPFSGSWTNSVPGQYDLAAIATDSDGLSATSAPARIYLQPVLVATGSVWKYFDKGFDLGLTWRAPSFQDSAWLNGPAQLGYGDGDEATVVSYGNEQNKYITTYFRRSFVVPNPAVLTNFLVRLLRDDGAVVYMNGVEVFRSNMPVNSSITFETLALGAAEDESRFYEMLGSSAVLVQGTNVIAVEVHQSARDSSDLGFDLELLGLRSFEAPRLTVVRLGQEIRLTWPLSATDHILEATSSLTANAWSAVTAPVTTNGALIEATLTANAAQQFFRLRQ